MRGTGYGVRGVAGEGRRGVKALSLGRRSVQASMRVRSRGRAWLVPLAVALSACVRDGASGDSAAAARQPPNPIVAPPDEPTCFRSPESVLLGPSAGGRSVGHPPGWIRLGRIAQGRAGEAELVDGNASGLSARWDRIAGDSLRVVGSDDFLRVELRVAITSDSLLGQGAAHSDADIEPDSEGRPGELRRVWRVIARRVLCDSMPRR